jgi:hypothetical protein
MRALAIVLLAGCTIHGRARPPETLPSAVLDHQDPSADTSQHPVMTRFTAGVFGPVKPNAADAAFEVLGDLAKLALDLASL